MYGDVPDEEEEVEADDWTNILTVSSYAIALVNLNALKCCLQYFNVISNAI